MKDDAERINRIDGLLNEGDRIEIMVEDGGVIIEFNGCLLSIGESLREAIDQLPNEMQEGAG